MTVPSDNEFIAASTTEAQFKTAFVTMLSHIRQMTIDVIEAQGGNYSYATMELFDENKVNIPANSTVRIAQGDDAGLYVWDGTALIKADADLLKQAIEYTDKSEISSRNKILNLHLALQAVAQSIANIEEPLTEQQKLDELYSQTRIMAQVSILEGFNPTDLDTGSVSNSKNKAYDLIFDFANPTSLIKVDFNTDSGLPTAKGNPIYGTATMTIDGASIKTFASLEVQGSSSQYYPKKNWTLALFTDSTYNDAVKIKIGNVPYHDEWIFKANYVDASHVRNILANRFWETIVQSRSGFPKREIDRYYVGKTGTNAIYTGAIGRVEGFPCVFNVNGEFYGIGDWNIGKKYFNYNLDRSNAKNILIDWGSWQSDITALSMNYNNADVLELKSPKKVTDTTVAYLKEWDTFAALTQSDFTTQASAHLLESNVVDYWLFSDFIYNYDGLGKNFQFVSQGDDIFLFMPYDLDSTFGSNFSGDGTISATAVLTKNDLPQATKDFWNKVKTTYSTQLKARYADLRRKGVFSVDNIYDLTIDLMDKFPKDIVIAEQAKWTGVPSVSYSNLTQIMSWVKARINYLDTQYTYTA